MHRAVPQQGWGADLEGGARVQREPVLEGLDRRWSRAKLVDQINFANDFDIVQAAPLGDGTYVASYAAKAAGSVRLTVKYNFQEIAGSPFSNSTYSS